jgi:GMP synthase (glutamine-hydrolysing)
MSFSQRKAVALRHIPFEDLGTLRPVLHTRGFSVDTVEATAPQIPGAALEDCDLLVVLGGPIGVYETKDYPFLDEELRLIGSRLRANKPTLGICLGSQLMAAALGARVYPGVNGSEIGWSALQAADEDTPKWFKPLFGTDVQVLHWHGDTFDLPQGAQRLASTELYKNQAFKAGDFALALQFHPEVTADGLEDWYVGHTCELRKKQIDISVLRAAGKLHAPLLAEPAKAFWNGWLDFVSL